MMIKCVILFDLMYSSCIINYDQPLKLRFLENKQIPIIFMKK